jgi:hypothetical protein
MKKNKINNNINKNNKKKKSRVCVRKIKRKKIDLYVLSVVLI